MIEKTRPGWRPQFGSACFRVGADDAIRLARELWEYCPATLRGFNRGDICVRLTSDGATLLPFLTSTLPRQAYDTSCPPA